MFPRWLSWLVVGFLAYLMITGNLAHRNAVPVPPVVTTASSASEVATTAAPATDPNTYHALTQATDLERWKKAINPDYAAHAHCDVAPAENGGLALKVIEDQEGSGDAAGCAQAITLHLTVWDARGKAAYTGDVDVTLGDRAVAAGLDAALLGIKLGGTRTVVLPPGALIHDKKSTAPKALLHALATNATTIVTATRLK